MNKVNRSSWTPVAPKKKPSVTSSTTWNGWVRYRKAAQDSNKWKKAYFELNSSAEEGSIWLERKKKGKEVINLIQLQNAVLIPSVKQAGYFVDKYGKDVHFSLLIPAVKEIIHYNVCDIDSVLHVTETLGLFAKRAGLKEMSLYEKIRLKEESKKGMGKSMSKSMSKSSSALSSAVDNSSSDKRKDSLRNRPHPRTQSSKTLQRFKSINGVKKHFSSFNDSKSSIEQQHSIAKRQMNLDAEDAPSAEQLKLYSKIARKREQLVELLTQVAKGEYVAEDEESEEEEESITQLNCDNTISGGHDAPDFNFSDEENDVDANDIADNRSAAPEHNFQFSSSDEDEVETDTNAEMNHEIERASNSAENLSMPTNSPDQFCFDSSDEEINLDVISNSIDVSQLANMKELSTKDLTIAQKRRSMFRAYSVSEAGQSPSAKEDLLPSVFMRQKAKTHVPKPVKPWEKNLSTPLPGLEVLYGNPADAKTQDDSSVENTTGKFAWNTQFQTIIEQLAAFGTNTDISQQYQLFLQLVNLVEDFLYCVKSYGKLIISEVYMEKKTINPVDIGGIAGGSKYIVGGVLFKFARDFEGLYGYNDGAAAVVAGHELKGLQAYFNCGVDGLCFPLMALIDYRGFRLIAISLLPIGGKSIVYGTCDGGRTIHTRSSKMNRLMKKSGNLLNLQEHPAGVEPSNRKLVYSAADLEGHIGTDGRCYLIDFSRSFPCETPKQTTIPGINLTHLFRPELVKSYPKQLCPDAYSGFADTKYNLEIDNACRYLQWKVIPGFAKTLPSLYEEFQQMLAYRNSHMDAGDIIEDESFRLTEVLHTHGINVRYLGLLALLLVEMVSRVMKCDLRKRFREEMRQVKKPAKEPFRKLLVHYLNVVFGTSDESTTYWQTIIQPNMINKFEGFSPKMEPNQTFKNLIETLVNFSLEDSNKSTNWKNVIFNRLSSLMAISLTPRAAQELAQNLMNKLDTKQPFVIFDIARVGAKVKHMNIVSHAKGYLQLIRARRERGNEQRIALLYSAISNFEEVLNSNTNNKVTLRDCAVSLMELYSQRTKQSKSNLEEESNPHKFLLERAAKYIKRAIAVDPDDSITNKIYATFLEDSGNLMEAEEYYIRSLLVTPTYLSGIREYCNYLTKLGENGLADVILTLMQEIRAREFANSGNNSM